MRKTPLAIAALLASAIALDATAQPTFVARKQVSADAARKLVDACIAYAQSRNTIVGVAVVDIAGVLIDMHLMQGGSATFSDTAILKAKTAAHWQRKTSELEDDVNSKRNGASAWIGDFPRSGGVPIVIEGEVAGAIGVGGGGGPEACAQAAIDSVIGKPQAAQR
jgi:glc operon protein GlcG